MTTKTEIDMAIFSVEGIEAQIKAFAVELEGCDPDSHAATCGSDIDSAQKDAPMVEAP